jgi:hypothetical protein
MVTDAELREMLIQFPQSSRDVLRRAARSNQSERDQLSSRLMREPRGQSLADLVDNMSLHPDFRRAIARVLGWIDAGP